MTVERATAELRAREPVFHRLEFRARREDFDRLMAPEFFEIGASGKMYSRDTVLSVLTERHSHPQVEDLCVEDFKVRQIDVQIFQATYVLLQPPDRWTRRSTLWRWDGFVWTVVFHQGTIFQR